MSTLYLPLKSEYFEAIKSGEKKLEYRLATAYWFKRLSKQPFDKIVLTKGYPKKDDKQRRITRPWQGCYLTKIKHKHFGMLEVEVFAIKIN